MTDGDSEWAIDLRDVAKVYKGRVHALQGIEMRVRRGEVFGLLGPNGAGKSTLVKIMMTVIRPTRAVGTVLGRPVGDKPTLARVGYLPESHRFPPYLTGRQTLVFFGALVGVARADARRRAEELLDVVGMAEWGGKKVSTYSKGMIQRVGLAQTMMSRPDLILLDEPTDGVDPVGRRDIRDVLQQLRDKGTTIFINSHLLSELEMICNRVAILVRGQVARQGTLDELTRAQQRYEVEVASDAASPATRVAIGQALRGMGATLKERARPPGPPSGAARALGGGAAPLPLDVGMMPGGAWVEVEGGLIRIGSTDPSAIQPALDALRAGGLMLRRVQPVRQSLEDLFIEAVTDPSTGLALPPGAGRVGRAAPPPGPPIPPPAPPHRHSQGVSP